MTNRDVHKSDAEKHPTSRYVFLHELVSQTADKVKIRSELLNILLAGRDTTASLLSNVWFELSKRPAIWSRLQHEVDLLNGGFPTFEKLKDMKYLRAVLNESLRLYPVVPENDRQADVDTVLPVGGGKDGKSPVFVKKGQVVHWSLYTMHRRKDLYGEDAEDFKPERWLDEGGKKGLRVGWEYLPFNGGARICIGRRFCTQINQPHHFLPFPLCPPILPFHNGENQPCKRLIPPNPRTIRPHRGILRHRPPHAVLPQDRKQRPRALAREADAHMHVSGGLQSRPVSSFPDPFPARGEVR